MTRLRSYGPRLRMNSNSMELKPGRGIMRKSAMAMQDATEQEDLNLATKDLVDKLRKNLYINNEVSGDNVNFNQDLKLMKRIAIQNNLQGNKVNTVQNVHEYNSNRGRPSGRRSESVNVALNKLSKALREVSPENDQNDQETIKQVAKALQRLAIKNDIKGNKVNTLQNVHEYNEELVEAIARAAQRLGDNRDDLMNDDLMKFAEELRRIAIKNDITGHTVNTKQEVKEYNDDVVSSIVNAFRRIAIKNDIKGKVVNTEQKVQEYNDDVARAVVKAIRRLAIDNNIKGKEVNTKQDVKEYNNDDPSSFNDHNGAAKILQELYKPFEKNGQEDPMTQEDYVDTRRNVYVYDKPVNSVVNKVTNIKTFQDTFDRKQTQPWNMLELQTYNQNPFRRVLDEISSDSDVDDADDSDDTDADSSDDLDEQEEGSLEGDDFGVEENKSVEDEINDKVNRRMTVNNNISEKALESRRLAIGNNIKGQTVNTQQKIDEFNRPAKRPAEKNNSIVVPAVKEKPKPAVKPVVDKISPETIAPKEPQKKISCKTKEGKQITDEDLVKFMDLLDKLKATQRISDAIRSQK